MLYMRKYQLIIQGNRLWFLHSTGISFTDMREGEGNFKILNFS